VKRQRQLLDTKGRKLQKLTKEELRLSFDSSEKCSLFLLSIRTEEVAYALEETTVPRSARLNDIVSKAKTIAVQKIVRLAIRVVCPMDSN